MPSAVPMTVHESSASRASFTALRRSCWAFVQALFVAMMARECVASWLVWMVGSMVSSLVAKKELIGPVLATIGLVAGLRLVHGRSRVLR